MALGTIGAIIDEQVLDLALDGANENANIIYRVAAGIYMLVYTGTDNTQNFATFAINETTGVVSGTIIDELSVLSSYASWDPLRCVEQIPNTRVWITGTASNGATLTITTVGCDADGNNIVVIDTETFSVGGTQGAALPVYIAPNVIGVAMSGSVARFLTIDISNAGVIAATPIQAAATIGSGLGTIRSFSWVRSAYALITHTAAGSTQVAVTFSLTAAGVFTTTAIGSATVHSGDDLAHVWQETIDSATGVAFVTGRDPTGVLRAEPYYKMVVNSDATSITVSTITTTTTATINHSRPRINKLTDGGCIIMPGGGVTAYTYDATLAAISSGDIMSTPTGTKGAAFVPVSAIIGAAAHIGNDTSGVIQYITTFSLQSEDDGATITGTLIGSDEEAVRDGGKTIIITLAGATWHANIGTDSAATTALIAGIDSNLAEEHGWDASIANNLTYNNVIRTSDNIVTITMPSLTQYVITASEVITITVPDAALA